MNWERCLQKREAKNIKPDDEIACSLQKTSANKAYSSRKLPLSEQTAAAKISLGYDAVRELLESLAIRKGFKIYNHVCYTAFLKDVLRASELGEAFDALRVIRNDINYYGKDVSVTEANTVLADLERLRLELLKLLLKSKTPP